MRRTGDFYLAGKCWWSKQSPLLVGFVCKQRWL